MKINVFSWEYLLLIPYCNVVVICNRAGWDKNWTDVKRKGRLQGVYTFKKGLSHAICYHFKTQMCLGIN